MRSSHLSCLLPGSCPLTGLFYVLILLLLPFETLGQILIPMVPNQEHLYLVLPHCESETKPICGTHCVHSPTEDQHLFAIVNLTRAFNTAFQDSVTTLPALNDALLIKLEAIAGTLTRSAMESTSKYLLSRSICEDKLELLLLARWKAGPSFPFKLMTEGFLEAAAAGKEARKAWHLMIIDSMAVWYAEDLTRRVRMAIEDNCGDSLKWEMSTDSLDDDACVFPPDRAQLVVNMQYV